MKWYKNLYLGTNARKDKNSIIKKIKKNRFQLGAYVLTLPESPDNIMDIYPAFILLQPAIKKKDIFVIGIAADKEEAFEVFQKILMDNYKKYGNVSIKDYLKDFK